MDTRNIENSRNSFREGYVFYLRKNWKFNKIYKGGIGFWMRRTLKNPINSLREGYASVYERAITSRAIVGYRFTVQKSSEKHVFLLFVSCFLRYCADLRKTAHSHLLSCHGSLGLRCSAFCGPGPRRFAGCRRSYRLSRNSRGLCR